jgi:branched-chain amino acid aminotransferase
MEEIRYCYFNGELIPQKDAKVGVMTHAFNYGTGCFEGIRAYWNAEQKQLYVMKLREHVERLSNSCRILLMSMPGNVDEIFEKHLEVLRRNKFERDVYIRPLVYKATETVGVRLHDLTDGFVIFTTEMGNYLDVEKGIACGVASWRRVDDTMIPARAKVTGAYINGALAKTEAIQNGFDEAIQLNMDGHVSEGSGENIFIVKDGAIITPAVNDNILVGITRGAVIELAKDLGIPVMERSLDRTELYCCDECFMTGTAAQVSPVVGVDRRPVGDGVAGPLTLKIQSIYFDAVRGKNEKYMNWLTPVY